MRAQQVLMLAGCDEKKAEPPKPVVAEKPAPVSPVRPGDDVKHGEYLATIAACLECHIEGGRESGTPALLVA